MEYEAYDFNFKSLNDDMHPKFLNSINSLMNEIYPEWQNGTPIVKDLPDIYERSFISGKYFSIMSELQTLTRNLIDSNPAEIQHRQRLFELVEDKYPTHNRTMSNMRKHMDYLQHIVDGLNHYSLMKQRGEYFKPVFYGVYLDETSHIFSGGKYS